MEHISSTNIVGHDSKVGYHLVPAISTTSDTMSSSATRPLTLFNLPLEIRREILKSLLSLDRTTTRERGWKNFRCADMHECSQTEPFQVHNSANMSFMLFGAQTTTIKMNLHTNILVTCKQLYAEGIGILQRENKFLVIDGLERYAPIEKSDTLSFKIPSWNMIRMGKHAGQPPTNFRINVVASILDLNGRMPNQRSMVFYPMSCLEIVCQAISYLPLLGVYQGHRPHVPLLSLSFWNGLTPQVLGIKKENWHSQAFKKILRQNILDHLGLWLATTTILDPRGTNYISARPSNLLRWFCAESRMRLTEGKGMSLLRMLRRLVELWKEGESRARENSELVRRHFTQIKTLISQLVIYAPWYLSASADLHNDLLAAYKWACAYVAMTPIPNEAAYLCSTTPIAVVETVEVIWRRLHLVDSLWPLQEGTSHLYGWHARLHLRKAELAYLDGESFEDCAQHLISAMFNLVPTAILFDPDAETKLQKAAVWAGKFCWDDNGPSWLPDDIVDTMLGLNRDNDFWTMSWLWMGGNSEDEDPVGDRKCFLGKCAKVRALIETRHGKVGKCPFDAEVLLDHFN